VSLVIPRRRFLASASLATGGLLLSGCQKIAESSTAAPLLRLGERLTMRTQRLLMSKRPLVREFSRAEITKVHPVTGTASPRGDRYAELAATGFRDFRLQVGGLVNRPLALSLPELKRLPARTQITQHQCDEGWSAIGEWTGTPVGELLMLAGLQPEARYIVFHCLDAMDEAGEHYYESLDLFDAFHPQTILAYGMNGAALPVRHGAPLRLRAELHIGYKNAKFVEGIEAVASLAGLRGGQGSYWADRGFQWYVGM
jgi:DMSO/TMAO reductase YedYZ molybdopterin-dependent catalytic subunit